jgi:hypothetical protein
MILLVLIRIRNWKYWIFRKPQLSNLNKLNLVYDQSNLFLSDYKPAFGLEKGPS